MKALKKGSAPSPSRLWYNKWIEENAFGVVLDVGKSQYWDYEFPTIDTNKKLKPTFVGNIEKTDFNDNSYDVVLCNGMYEVVDSPQKMIDEVMRITRGVAIFGFVGKGYKPYRKPWKYFDGEEKLPPHEKVDFGNKYHFLICHK